MDVVQLRYFLAVCEHGSFTGAARACGVSQPAVTAGVRRLERAIGVVLFERRQPVRLTSAGERLRPLIERVRAATDAVRAACAEVATGAARRDSASRRPRHALLVVRTYPRPRP